jgi:hypothetical protein
MPPRTVLAWTIAIVDLAVFALAIAFWPGGPASLVDVVTFLALPIAFGGVGALLTSRVPGNRIGPILLTGATGFAVMAGSNVYAHTSLRLADGSFPGTTVAAILANVLYIPALLLVLIVVPLLFPDGRLISPRWRWVVIVAALAVTAATLESLFVPTDLLDVPGFTNPLAMPGLVPLLTTLSSIAAITSIPLFVAAGAALVVRYRRGGPIEQLQVRWLAATASAAGAVFAVAFLVPPGPATDVATAIGLMLLCLLPVSIAVAILRYRLYDIDRIVSRTIGYGLVTAIVVTAFWGLVLVMQPIVAQVTGGQTLAVAASTLVVATLFAPLRRRIQNAVDHRFDRAKVDADRAAAVFARTIRDTTELDEVRALLLDVVNETVAPARTTIVLRATPARTASPGVEAELVAGRVR